MVTPKFGTPIRSVTIQQDTNGMWKVDTADSTMPNSILAAAVPRSMTPLEVFAFVGTFIAVTAQSLHGQIGGSNAAKN